MSEVPKVSFPYAQGPFPEKDNNPVKSYHQDYLPGIEPDSYLTTIPSLIGKPARLPQNISNPAHEYGSQGPFKPLQAIEVQPNVELLPVPDVRQSTDYSCGPAALQAVLMYYGEDYLETDLMEKCNTTKDGTSPLDLLRAARGLGFEAELREQMTIEDLDLLTRNKVPVIISAQCWREGENENKPWKDLWDDGHYMVVIGIDKENVYFEDPSMLGSKGYIKREEFLERWHDIDEKKYYQMGIVIRGKVPKPPPAFMPVLSESPPVEFPF